MQPLCDADERWVLIFQEMATSHSHWELHRQIRNQTVSPWQYVCINVLQLSHFTNSKNVWLHVRKMNYFANLSTLGKECSMKLDIHISHNSCQLYKCYIHLYILCIIIKCTYLKPSVLWHCLFGDGKGTQPVKNCTGYQQTFTYGLNQVSGYTSQHIWCLSQARINWEGCSRSVWVWVVS